MGDLEHVDARGRGHAASQELRVDGLLDVAGQEHPSRSEAEVEHGRDVVDARARIGRRDGHLAARRPADVERRIVEPQPVTGRHPTSHDVEAVKGRVEGGVAGARPAHADLGHEGDTVACQQQGKAGHVILVRVRQHDDVEPPIPRRQPSVEQDEQPVRVRTPIDEQATTAIPLDEDGVALADIEHGHAQPAVGPR
jgi:hypothetical protein